jgi:hypothetical protein
MRNVRDTKRQAGRQADRQTGRQTDRFSITKCDKKEKL